LGCCRCGPLHFPGRPESRVSLSDDRIEFVHPLSGRDQQGNAFLNSNDFPSKDDAEQILDDILPAFNSPDAAARFFHVWRLWLHHAVTHHAGQQQRAETIAYLPADTRIPDASIWHHLSIVSALEATRGADGQVHPAFLLFQNWASAGLYRASAECARPLERQLYAFLDDGSCHEIVVGQVRTGLPDFP
jgi:hypothetical protein